MSRTVEADDRGRIVIPHGIHKKYGDRYRNVELDDSVELIPLIRIIVTIYRSSPVRGRR
jgi:bifunctional DNA-binding transcriptional regulator/antitoxin component of YhaV-PrlF toxin-antitoxin module